MASRDLTIRIDADPSGADKGFKSAAASASIFEKELRKLDAQQAKRHQAMNDLGKVGLGIGVAMAAGVGMALKTFADFDAQMSSVQAATGETAEAMGDLREAALEAGARTVFSATEAADAIEQLAKAGVSTADILNGGLNGALDLAAAGSLEVGEAAEIAATAMTQFGLEGREIPHVADLLAAAAGKAQGEVTDMGMALKQAGLVASQTGLSIEETTAGLASFASAGLLGSDAGTSFKSMLQRLTPQSAEAEAKMRELGISAYDAQGNFIGLEAFAGNLQASLKDLTVEQRNSAMATIFGSDAVRAASVLYNQGAEGIAGWTAAVDDAGYAQEVAATKLDNLKGDIEAFTGSLETALIKTGAAGDGFARAAVQQATDIVNAYSNMAPEAQAATLAVGSVVGAASLAAGGFLLLAPRIAETRDAMRTLNAEMPRTTRAMSGLGKAVGIAGVVTTAAIAIDQLTDAMAKTPPGVKGLTNSLADFLRTGEATGDLVRIVGQDFEDLRNKVYKANQTKLLTPFRDKDIVSARRELEALDTALAGLVSSGHGDEAAKAFATMKREAVGGAVSLDEFQRRFPAYEEAIDGVAAEAKLAGDAQGEMAGAVSDATGQIEQQTESLADLMEKVRAFSEQVLGLRDASRGYEAAIDAATAALKENGRNLDINTEAGRDNEAALDAIASSAGDVLEQMVASEAPISDVTAKFGQQREALIRAAEGFGMTRQQAEAYAASVLRIPDKKATEVVLTGADMALAQVDRLRAYLGALPSVKTVTVRVDEVLGVTVSRGSAGRITERASGGAYGPGPLLVGEKGPELLYPDIGGFVVNHRATLEAMNSYATPARVVAVPQGGAASSGGSDTALLSQVAGLRADVIGLGKTLAAAADRDVVLRSTNNVEMARVVREGQARDTRT